MAKEKRHGIVRVRKRTSPFAMIDKRFTRDPRLSWKAKGLLTYLLSQPDDWKVIISDLVRQSTDGEASVRQGLKELEGGGYLLRVRRADRKSGRFIAWEMTIFETPELAAEARLAEPSLFETVSVQKAEKTGLLAHESETKPPEPRFSQNTPDSDFPHVVHPHVGLPHVAHPHVENQRLLKNDGTKTDLTNDGGGGAPVVRVASSPLPSPQPSPGVPGEGAEPQSGDDPPPFLGEGGKPPLVLPAAVLGDPVMLLVANEFHAGDARQLVAQYGEQQVRTAVANADVLAARGTLKHRRRYIAKAITSRYQPIEGGRETQRSTVTTSAPIDDAKEQRDKLARAQAERDQLDAQRRDEDAMLDRLTETDWRAHVAEILPRLAGPARAKLATGTPPRAVVQVRYLVVARLKASRN